MHHDQGALGSAAYYDAVYRQLSIMKDMGVNAVRITHNPSNKQYLEICNELGQSKSSLTDGNGVRTAIVMTLLHTLGKILQKIISC